MSGVFREIELSPNLLEQAKGRIKNYIDLTSSNPTAQGLLFPPEILAEATANYWQTRRYNPDPHGVPSARQAVRNYYAGRPPALDVPLDRIFLTASTSEAYSLLFALLTDPGDNVLAPEVTYPLFEYLAGIHRVELRPYRLDESRRWALDAESLAAQADERTRAVLLISPHNPTGMIVQNSQEILTRLGLPIICDEVFAPFTYAAPHTPPLGALHPELPVFHLNGISKLFALPDMKLGWVAFTGDDKEIYAGRLELLNDTFLGCNSLSQALLPTLFERGQPFIKEMQERVRYNFDFALGELAKCPAFDLAALPPDGGYYLFPKVRDWRDEDALVLYLLEQHGVLVHPGYFYGYEGNGAHVMLSCLTEPAKFAEGIRRLTAGLEARG